MSLTYTDELKSIAARFTGEEANDLKKFRRMIGPFTVRYEYTCRKFDIPRDPVQAKLCKAAEQFFESEADTEVSICPTTTTEEKKRAVERSDLCSLRFILFDRHSGLRLRMYLHTYCPEAREIELEYEEI